MYIGNYSILLQWDVRNVQTHSKPTRITCLKHPKPTWTCFHILFGYIWLRFAKIVSLIFHKESIVSIKPYYTNPPFWRRIPSHSQGTAYNIFFIHIYDDYADICSLHSPFARHFLGMLSKFLIPGKQVAVNFHQLETHKTSNPIA